MTDSTHKFLWTRPKKKRKNVEFLEKVQQSGKWPQQVCTTMLFLIPENVTSERPSCAHANVDSLVASLESARSGQVAAEVSS